MIKITLPKSYYWYIIAIIVAPMLIFLEYMTGYICIILSGNTPRGISVNKYWQRQNIIITIFIILIALFEELIFRKIWFDILSSSFGFSILATILLTSLIYGLNHLYFGIYTVLQKIISGALLGTLFCLSGGSVAISFIAHGLENLLISVIGGEQ
ncbi:CPBP family intramembrane metalloprotease [Aceticella autotrophica]|uniref:CPBP family intramembrane metalloprotease n=2 Tax=Aceticella autotrophica TaxID=2755338 RepID=A0A975AVG4_9THEO|nr:CPBP family intramembrane metalloprotease [Aceticella autotrophica]